MWITVISIRPRSVDSWDGGSTNELKKAAMEKQNWYFFSAEIDENNFFFIKKTRPKPINQGNECLVQPGPKPWALFLKP